MPGARRGRPLAAALAAAATACVWAALLVPPAQAATPLDGNGSWIWYVSDSGGTPRAVARKAKHERLDVVYVKSADGTNVWSQFDHRLVHALHKRGIEACAWPFVYGDSPRREAKASAVAADAGADCIVIDAEAGLQGNYRGAYIYMHKLRKLVGDDYPLGLSSFPYVDYHPNFPYSVFLGAGGATFNVPQVYWYAIGTSVHRAYEHTYRYNRPYGRPIYPVGQTYENPPKDQLLDFRRYANEYGAPGISWYSWQETSPRGWHVVRRRQVKGVPGYEAAKGYAHLGRGDRGDTVLFAQELLEARGLHPKPTAVFDARTEHAAIHFQNDHGLRPNGRIGSRMWKKLLKRDPQSTNWKQVKPPKALRRSATPARASSELPPGIGAG